MEQIYIFSGVVASQISMFDKIADNYTHTYIQTIYKMENRINFVKKISQRHF